MHRGLRWLNAFGVAVTLASALVVLGSDLFVPGYRALFGDAVVVVAGYAALHAWFLWTYVKGGRALPWIALARALAGLGFIGELIRVGLSTAPGTTDGSHWGEAFLATFVTLAPDWIAWTPARYVYQIVDFGPTAMFAFVFLGRGAWNAFSAFAFAEPWWRPLRSTSPILGRAVTALAVGVIVTCVWAFFHVVPLYAKTFSPDAQEVAQLVFAGIECEQMRAHDGSTTTDRRQRGDVTYHVRIRYGCHDTQVFVQGQDGRIGTARGPRTECCTDAT